MKKFLVCFLVFFSSSIVIAATLAGDTAVASMGWMEFAKFYLEVAAQLISGLMILATIVVRVIPGKADDEKAYAVFTQAQKYMAYLPTLGVNPRTKELEKALEELKKQNEELTK